MFGCVADAFFQCTQKNSPGYNIPGKFTLTDNSYIQILRISYDSLKIYLRITECTASYPDYNLSAPEKEVFAASFTDWSGKISLKDQQSPSNLIMNSYSGLKYLFFSRDLFYFLTQFPETLIHFLKLFILSS